MSTIEEARISLDKYLREKLKTNKPKDASDIPHWRLDWLDENPHYKDVDMFLKLEWEIDYSRTTKESYGSMDPIYPYAKNFKIVILDEDHYKEMAYICEKAGNKNAPYPPI